MAPVTCLTPEEYQQTGLPAEICYDLVPSPFGLCLVAAADNAVCAVSFTEGDQQLTVQELEAGWKRSAVVRDEKHIAGFADRVWDDPGSVRLLLKGTPFQILVWKALLTIPFGSTMSYKEVARLIGQPKATRAVGTAVGANPIAYLVPCHRVIAADGSLGGYRWGQVRKKTMLDRERGCSP